MVRSRPAEPGDPPSESPQGNAPPAGMASDFRGETSMAVRVATNAHLLRYDSVHGRFPGTVTVEGDQISLGNGKIKVSAERDPSKLPWKELGVDIALECTGIFTAKDKASAHLTAGA